MTADQAMWKEGTVNHSVGQLANHLLFWNRQQLDKFKGKNAEPFNGNNDETFNSFDKDSWTKVVAQLDAVLTEWETAIEKSDDTKLKSWYEIIGHISTHNAYHTGQIAFTIRQWQQAPLGFVQRRKMTQLALTPSWRNLGAIGGENRSFSED